MVWTIFALYIVAVIYLNHRSKYNGLKDIMTAHDNQVTIGKIGEKIVAQRLSYLTDEYDVEHNPDICVSQIDHLVFNHSLQLCFVIETKLWGGTITGNHNDEYWIQHKSGQADISLYNPIKQNRTHCNNVRRMYPDYHVYGIVVFVRNKKVPHFRCIVDENGVLNYIYKISRKINNDN